MRATASVSKLKPTYESDNEKLNPSKTATLRSKINQIVKPLNSIRKLPLNNERSGSRASSRNGNDTSFDRKINVIQNAQATMKSKNLLKAKLLRQIDDNLAQVGLDQES